MKIIVVVLQRLSANGICARAVISGFVRRGHEVVWVCNREADDPEPMRGVEFVQVKPRLVDNALARFNRNRAISKAVVILNRIGMLRSLGSWPLISKRYAGRVTEATFKAAADADVIIGAYTQIDALIAAHEAKSRNPRVRYVAWYLDSLAGGHGPRFLSEAGIEARGKSWDAKLLDNADAVVAMESSRAFHEAHSVVEPWYGRLHFLDLPLLDLDAAGQAERRTVPMGAKTIVYAGSLPVGIRSPDFFLRVLGHLDDGGVRVVFAGDASNESLMKAAERDPRIEVRGRMAHEEVTGLLASADCLLTFGNSLPSMTPSKIFEYMSYQKPIIATFPIDDEPSLPYLMRYGDTLLLDERGDPVEAARVLEGFLHAEHPPIPVGELEEKFWGNTPAAFCNLVESIGDNNDN